MALTHEILVQLAARWLRRKHAIVATEVVSWEEVPDAIGWHTNYTTLIECKTSRADFKADFKKWFRTKPGWGLGNYRWYLTPPGLIDVSELPPYWGLLETAGKNILTKVGAQPVPAKYELAESKILQSIIRRIGQYEPEGISIRAYTHQTRCVASVSIEADDELEDWMAPPGSIC